jgi:Omp85 superfamily domain
VAWSATSSASTAPSHRSWPCRGQRSNTASYSVALGGKFYWNQNRDNLVAGVVGGQVSNDYLDFLGTGQEVRSDENLRAFFVRYQHEFFRHVYFGAQAVYSNYDVEGADPTSQQILDRAGLAGSVSSGVGLIVSYDTRDNTNNPTDGILARLNNVAFRKGLGSDADFDVVTGDGRSFSRTGENNVVVVHAKWRWTRDAPESKESTVELRGYTRGQYLGRNALTLEAEDRYMFKPRWGAKVFGGVACLYGDGQSCNGDNVYPMIGAGVFYVLKPEANMVVSAEVAKGNGDNRGFYLSFGHRF